MLRKRIYTLFLLFALIIAFGTGKAYSALLGISGDLDYPRIEFGKIAGAAITYDYKTGFLDINAKDMTIKLTDSSDLIYLSGKGFETALTMTLKVTLGPDNKPSSISGTMEEKIVKGSVTIGNNTYNQGTVLLSGTVYDFGWGESGDLLGNFDFRIKDVTGALVSDGIWPPYGIDKRETGIYLWAEKLNGWDGSWTQDFSLSKVKGQKAAIGAPPVPLPHTALLLGSGLGMVGILRWKRKR